MEVAFEIVLRSIIFGLSSSRPDSLRQTGRASGLDARPALGSFSLVSWYVGLNVKVRSPALCLSAKDRSLREKDADGPSRTPRGRRSIRHRDCTSLSWEHVNARRASATERKRPGSSLCKGRRRGENPWASIRIGSWVFA